MAAGAPIRADVEPLISQRRKHMTWRQSGVLGLVAGHQVSLALLLAKPIGDMTITAFTGVLTVPITNKVLSPALERAQTDADLTAGANQARGSIICLAYQLDHLPPVCDACQASVSSERNAFHFSRSTNNVNSSMAFTLCCSSFYSCGEACG